MIASMVLFLALVSVVASVAAWLAEEALEGLGVPSRWLWLTSMLAGPALLLAPIVMPAGASEAAGRAFQAVPVVPLAPLLVGGAEATSVSSDIVLGALWVTLSLGMAGLLGWTHLRLRRARRGWDSGRVADRDGYVSVDLGPAGAGWIRPGIVLPRWALSLPEGQLRLVVLHEEEHLKGRDTALLGLALVLVTATPWNPVTWWQFRRLRTAVEVDCDRRVLSRAPNREQYGSSLLTVAARASGSAMGLAAFTERSHALRRRILAMTRKKSRWTPMRASGLVALSLIVGLQACLVDSPVAIDETDIQVQEAVVGDEDASVNIRSEPTFTPFTVAPSITNRESVIAMMVREYPPLLRDAGIGGTVRVYFFINERGLVEQVRLDQSSGHAALDEAALNVAGAYEFSPARNDDEPVPVWVSFPITFQVN